VSRRPLGKIVADLIDACNVSADLVARGRQAYDDDRMLRLAAEAIIGRIGDAAAKLRDQVGDELPSEIPWNDVIANRIVVDHAYHRVDYTTVWNTLESDVPELARAVTAWAHERGVQFEAD
jgi:uncharacterized protein with HEPN domain